MSTCTLKTLPEGLELVSQRSLKLLAVVAVYSALEAMNFVAATEGWRLVIALITSLPLPVLWVFALRSARSRKVLLRREGQRVFCNGEELEVARIENRVVFSLLKVPRAYALSLWGLTIEGRAIEVALGELPDLFAASKMAGTVEDFLAQSTAPSRALAHRR
ncbi:MAG: hypothetical protein QM723_28055 [Myxococcaceae bacterium]